MIRAIVTYFFLKEQNKKGRVPYCCSFNRKTKKVEMRK